MSAPSRNSSIFIAGGYEGDTKDSSQDGTSDPGLNKKLERKESADDIMAEDAAGKDVLEAIYTGDPRAVKLAMMPLDGASAKRALRSAAHLGRIPIMHAALKGDLDLFNVVLKEMHMRLNENELKKNLTTTTWRQETLLSAAAAGGNKDIFEKVVNLLHGAILEVTMKKFPFGGNVLRDAARKGDLGIFNEVAKILKTNMDEQQARDMVFTRKPGILTAAVMNGNGHAVAAWAEVLLMNLPRDEVRAMLNPIQNDTESDMIRACTDIFEDCAQDPSGCLPGLAVLIAYGAKTSEKDFVRFASTFAVGHLKECFIDALAWVDNPFIPGMIISVALDDAAPKGPEREGRALRLLMDTVDDVVLEVLERLPQTLRRFQGGVDGCKIVFEPEVVEPYDPGFDGPLKLALEERQFTETFCVSPLVFEYLSRQFVAGLPDMSDTECILSPSADKEGTSSDNKWDGKSYLHEDGLVAHLAPGKLMQGIGSGASAMFSNLITRTGLLGIFTDTILPGAQFIGVGMLTRPDTYYKVAAVRLAMDFVVHLAMLSLYAHVVLVADNQALTTAEKVLIFHVTAAIVAEIAEMHQGGPEYFQDKWNILDMLSLVLLSAGLYIRFWESNGGDIAVAKVFFALSAPLIFARFLFFAQILPRQGLVVEMIAIMLGEIVHFGVVMGVMMVGFTVSFLALLLDTSTTYGAIFVSAFKAMLGEFSVLDEYDFIYSFWGTLLIVLYLVIMTIILLNLLIAVLSTEHAKVDERSDREFSVSKVRMMKLYRKVVENDLLPPPFNLVQLAILLPFYVADRLFHLQTRFVVRHAVGVTIFWAVTGPIIMVLGSLLWLVSIPHAVWMVWEGTTFGNNSLFFRRLLSYVIVPFYSSGVGLVLLALWMQSAFFGALYFLMSSFSTLRSSDGANNAESKVSPCMTLQQETVKISIAEMLRKAPEGLGVRGIWEYLEDPNTPTPAMRREEQSRPATVGSIRHIKNQLDALRENVLELSSRSENPVEELGRLVDNRLQLEGRVKELVDEMEHKMRDEMGTLRNKLDAILEMLRKQ